MKLNKLASAILRGTFLIDERSAHTLFPIAERFLNGEKVTWFESADDKPKEYLEAYCYSLTGDRISLKAQQQGGNNQSIFSAAPVGSIAVIPMEGTIMKDDNCGSPGTDTLGAWLMDALLSPNIDGAVAKMNTPGGTVEGTAELQEIMTLVGSLMPLEVYCDGQLCSAGYWIASSARITASSGTVEIGSIGTAARFQDYKNPNVNSHYITADESFDKNKDALEALKGNYTPIKTNIINPTNNIFKSSVKENRGEKLQLTDVTNDAGETIGQYPLTGQVYLAQAAIDLGLIDAIGNLDSVMESVRSRADSDEFSQKQNPNNMSLFGNKNKKFQSLETIKTKKAAEITEQELEAVNEEFVAEGYENVVVITTAHLQEANDTADAIGAGLTSLNAALGEGKHKKTIAEAIKALVADRDAEHLRAETYGDQPGEKPTNPRTTKQAEGANVDTPEQTDYQKKMARKQASFKTATKA